MSAEHREWIGFEDPSALALYVTVRAIPDPLDIWANLRAPLVIHETKGYQVINASMAAPLQAPLFALPAQPEAEPSRSADAA
jgi:flagellar assembly factor FliW